MGAATMKDFGIDRLPPEQRLALATEILESLGQAKAGSPLPPGLKAELLLRDAELDATPSSALTWEEIRASVEKRP